MEEQIERWELRSGTWLRHRATGTWCLAALRDGTAVDPGLPPQDVACLAGASREPATGERLPPDFNYSPRTGAPLDFAITLDPPWVPPFGASALPGVKSASHGLRQTPLPLALARAHGRSAGDPPDRTLPPLPPGQYRFVAGRFGAACPTLLAVEPERGSLLVLLPESRSWSALGRIEGASWGQRLRNPRGWRMEVVEVHGHATAYCPSAAGLAAITPNVIGLGYAIAHAGDGPALGGPVAWGAELWAPVLGKGHVVQLVGWAPGAASHIVLPTHAPVPHHGFEAPVFDDAHVVWPCDEGRLVLQRDAAGGGQCRWIAWPSHARPLFAIGCPHRADSGAFWQPCRRDDDGSFAFVGMANAEAEAIPVDALRLCTGRSGYAGTWRIDGEPWRPTSTPEEDSTDVVLPLLESLHDGAVLGLRIEAPHGVPALLHGQREPRRAVLQVELQGQPATAFGTLHVRKPWLALPFVHDGHLWVDHPDLPQVAGWELAV